MSLHDTRPQSEPNTDIYHAVGHTHTLAHASFNVKLDVRTRQGRVHVHAIDAMRSVLACHCNVVNRVATRVAAPISRVRGA